MYLLNVLFLVSDDSTNIFGEPFDNELGPAFASGRLQGEHDFNHGYLPEHTDIAFVGKKHSNNHQTQPYLTRTQEHGYQRQQPYQHNQLRNRRLNSGERGSRRIVNGRHVTRRKIREKKKPSSETTNKYYVQQQQQLQRQKQQLNLRPHQGQHQQQKRYQQQQKNRVQVEEFKVFLV